MNFTPKKFVLYVLFVIIISLLGFWIYDSLGLHRFHMTRVQVFCNKGMENVGITNTRSLQALKYYINDRNRFDELEAFKQKNYFDDTIHFGGCKEGLLFSKRWNGARSVVLEKGSGEVVVTVLTDHVIFLEEEK